jgi:hypothetical protein
VRVGPLSAGTLVAGWPRACDCESRRRPGWHALTGTLLAARDQAPARWLEGADVIVTSGQSGQAGPGEWLRRYPGCAVAVAWTSPGECAVATRYGVLRGVAVSGQQGDGGALACAAFVHGWLVAGWPLALLAPACLGVGPGAAVGWPDAGSPLSFRFGYCAPSGDDPSPDAPGPLP